MALTHQEQIARFGMTAAEAHAIRDKALAAGINCDAARAAWKALAEELRGDIANQYAGQRHPEATRLHMLAKLADGASVADATEAARAFAWSKPEAWRAEFPDYPADCIPALGNGWTDLSWRNDGGPSFRHDASDVVLWCLWPDPAMREGIDAPHYLFVQTSLADDVESLRCDTLGDVRDVLDHLATIPGATMADALLGARLRLNQLTADDARALMAENDAAPNPCPDLHAHCVAIIAAANGSAGQ